MFEPSTFRAIDSVEESERGEYEITNAVESLRHEAERVSVVDDSNNKQPEIRPGSLFRLN